MRSPQDDRERNGGRGEGERGRESQRARGCGGGGGRIAGVVLSVDQYSHIQTAEVGGGGERERARREGELLVMYSQSTSTVTSRQERERGTDRQRERQTFDTTHYFLQPNNGGMLSVCGRTRSEKRIKSCMRSVRGNDRTAFSRSPSTRTR